MYNQVVQNKLPPSQVETSRGADDVTSSCSKDPVRDKKNPDTALKD